MSKKLTYSFRLQIVLSAYALTLGFVLLQGKTLIDSPKPTLAQEIAPIYYAQSPAPITLPPENTYVPHELIVHFVPGFAPHELEAQDQRRKKLSQSLFGICRLTLESLLNRTASTPRAQEHLKNISQVDSQFKALEKSKMFDDENSGAGETYIIRFAEDTDLENARIAYENLEEVSYVQYNFIYSLQQ